MTPYNLPASQVPTMNNFSFVFNPFLVTILLVPWLPNLGVCSSKLRLVRLPGVTGPESVAFDCHGKGPYVGVSDGRILKWGGTHLGWVEFATNSPNWDRKVCHGSTNPDLEPKCGRPLGLKFDKRSCELYIADAYFGLLVVPQNDTVAKQLAVSAEGLPFRFTNSLDVDPETGVVYFTDSSTIYQRREFLSIIFTGDRTGRLMKYDPRSKKVTVLLRGLAFANGVALSKDKSFLLVAETSRQKILKLSLRGTKVSVPTHFALLPRPPDNIKSTEEGDFWVGMATKRGSMTSSVHQMMRDPVGLKLDREGKVLMELDGHGGEMLDSVSEVEQHYGLLYIGSVLKPYFVVIKA